MSRLYQGSPNLEKKMGELKRNSNELINVQQFNRKERKEERNYNRVDLMTRPVLEHTVEPRKMTVIFTLIHVVYLNIVIFNSENIPRCIFLLRNTAVLYMATFSS